VKRREFITLIGGAAAAWPLAARAQQPAFQVGFLYPGPQGAASPRIAAYSSGLQAGGIRPEQVSIIARVTGGDAAPLAPMAADLVARKVDVIAAISPAAVRAAQAATATIPIVAGDLESDPVASGFVASIARPGGNITGVFLDFPDFSKKWLEALKEAVPQTANVAVFWDPATGPMQRQAVEAAAQTLNLKLAVLQVPTRADFEPAFQSVTQRGAEALVMLSSPLIGANSKLLAGLALAHRLPAVTLFTDFARDGGLMAYGPNLLGIFRQGGVLAAKLLQGAKPAETPVETPTKFEFVLNLKTAAQLGITVPASVLMRADEVIE
jgi:putative tryptophan/tyrosine transport system substrate-binding protein